VWHTEQTIESLKKNTLAAQSDLIIFSDGPKIEDHKASVKAVRDYIHSVRGFKNVLIFESEQNKGLAESIIQGVTQALTKHPSVIVVEDDLVCSPYFLSYMNQGLHLYQHDLDVISIHGYIYPVQAKLPDSFFLRGADCWGWATWQRGWQLFEKDGKKLLTALREARLTDDFDFGKNYPYTKMLQDQIGGKNNSWAVRWYASAYLGKKLTLYPGKSYVRNIGNDDSGTHSKSWSKNDFETTLQMNEVSLQKIEIFEDPVNRKIISEYFKKVRKSLLTKVIGKFINSIKR
jgi:hypothetical protein